MDVLVLDCNDIKFSHVIKTLWAGASMAKYFIVHPAASCNVFRLINGPHRITGPCGENRSLLRSSIVWTEVRRMSRRRRCTSVRACLSAFQPLFFMKTPRSHSSLLLRLSQEATFAWYFRFLDDVIHHFQCTSFSALGAI